MLHGTFYTFILSWPVNVDFQSHMTMDNMHNIHNIHNMQNMHNMHIMHGMQKCILCIICIIFCIQTTRIVVLRTLISCNNIFSYKFKSFLRGVKWRVFVEPQLRPTYQQTLQFWTKKSKYSIVFWCFGDNFVQIVIFIAFMVQTMAPLWLAHNFSWLYYPSTGIKANFSV